MKTQFYKNILGNGSKAEDLKHYLDEIKLTFDQGIGQIKKTIKETRN